MIWCRFDAGEGPKYGLVEGDMVSEHDGLPWENSAPTGKKLSLAKVKLLVPVIPSNFYCAGINYRDHVRRMAAMRNAEPVFPTQADIG